MFWGSAAAPKVLSFVEIEVTSFTLCSINKNVFFVNTMKLHSTFDDSQVVL